MNIYDLEFYITGPEDIIKEQLTKEGYTGNKNNSSRC